MSGQGLLRLLTCGSVDDGKSTLIGRLLYDSRAILADALDALADSSRRRGLSEVDLSLLTDGLQAEREQGITIDVAYRYFATDRRSFILADAPGHEQYTRNMVTGASTADVAVVLVDARKGILPQTRRHMALAHLLGLSPIVVAVNKMDLVEARQERFQDIEAEITRFAERLGIRDLRVLPMSALKGDMVVERGTSLSWYEGPTLMELLETVEVRRKAASGAFRFPVQLVCRPRHEAYPDYRGYQGRVDGGRVAVGDPVVVLPSGVRTRIQRIETFDGDLAEAFQGQSVTLHLEDAVDASRGDLLAAVEGAPVPTREVTATLCWLSERPLEPGARLRFRHGTSDVRVRVGEVRGLLDLHTLTSAPAGTLRMNDIATVGLTLQNALPLEPYADHRGGGAFVLVDEATHATVAAGMVLSPEVA